MSRLANRVVLLDTCFVIKALQYGDEKYFDNFFSILMENNCRPCISNMVLFEFMRGCKTPKHMEEKKKFLSGLSAKIMDTPLNLILSAIKIANIYANKNIQTGQISLTDCLNSALLQKYANLVLVTLDVADYPLILHDRFDIITIDTKKEILNIAFLEFIEGSFAALSEERLNYQT